ncbi:MAG: YraN family protein, partial [Acidobacteriota bacterium]
ATYWRIMRRLLKRILRRPRNHQTDPPRPDQPQRLGQRGEELARRHLAAQGYRLVAAGFTVPIGRSRRGRPVWAEIDLLAWDETVTPSILCVIEVKTRRSDELSRPEAAVDARKQRHLILATRIVRRLLRLDDEPVRYDVVAVLSAPDAAPVISLHKDFFRE